MIRIMDGSIHPIDRRPPRQKRRGHFLRAAQPGGNDIRIEAAAGEAHELTPPSAAGYAQEVVPTYPDTLAASLGTWLKRHLQEGRNTIRFLLPQKGTGDIYYERELLVLARAVYLALQWQQTEKVYADLAKTFQRDELRPKLRGRFDRFAILSEWNYAEPVRCHFAE